jgi:hypothetical protein
MNHRNDVSRPGPESPSQRVRFTRLAPLDVEPADLGAVSLAHLHHPIAKIAVDDDQHLRAIGHEIRHDGFHPRCTGPGDRQRKRSLSGPKKSSMMGSR